MSDVAFDLSDRAVTDSVEMLSRLIRRVVADNPGPMTFNGTCTYIVGRGRVAVIDPGPDLPAHRAALLDAVRGETVTHIVVTHTHIDHSPGARPLQDATGAPIVGCGPHRAARPLASGETDTTEGSGDLAHRPDLELLDGDAVAGPGWTLQAVATPGHTANHLAFAFLQENALFSGDHVMAWSTTVVAPPGGSMTAYLASLERLRGRSEEIYWPGHGGPVRDPDRFVRALIGHRRQREAAILRHLADGPRRIAEIVPAIYAGLAPGLQRAAALSTYAHLEDLVTRGLAATEDGAALPDSTYRIA